MAKVAVVAMNCKFDKAYNMEKFLHYIEEAAEQGVELILFPEVALQMFPPSMAEVDPEAGLYQQREAELIPEGPSTQTLIAKAKEHNMYIAWGMAERDPKRIDVLYNSCVLVGPEGYVGHYRKVHNPLTERLYYFPGNEYKVFDTKLGKIGIMICFDKAFPEAARSLTVQGAELILCPTAWPSVEKTEDCPSLYTYNVFDRARAAENMVWFVGANHVGHYEKGDECGHSHIIDPYGKDVCNTYYEEGMAVADIDIQGEYIRARHYGMMMSNLIKDRRPDTYGALTEINEYSLMNGLGAVTEK